MYTAKRSIVCVNCTSVQTFIYLELLMFLFGKLGDYAEAGSILTYGSMRLRGIVLTDGLRNVHTITFVKYLYLSCP